MCFHIFSSTTSPSDFLPSPRAFSISPYTLGLCLTWLTGRISPVSHFPLKTCCRLYPGDAQMSFRFTSTSVCCLRRDMTGSAIPITFRLII